MRLKKQSGYAVRIVMDCALAGGELTRIADIARRYKITKHNIAKTVPILVRQGIIEAVRGRNGGIRLARSPAGVTIGEIVRATESSELGTDGFSDYMGEGQRGPAQFDRMLDDALEAFISVLDQHTVADIIVGKNKFQVLTGEDESEENGQGEPRSKTPDENRVTR